eukprot:857583-Alexandrium_andersonii.AAC.1
MLAPDAGEDTQWLVGTNGAVAADEVAHAATRRFGSTFSGEAADAIHPQSDAYRPMVLLRGDLTIRADVVRCIGE